MNKRTIAYFRKMQALKIIANPLSCDLATLLNASMYVSRSKVVRKHIGESLNDLAKNFVPQYRAKNYRLTA